MFREVWKKVSIDDVDNNDVLRIAILLPFYKERFEDIATTFHSIAEQVYPRDRMTVFIIVERGDSKTIRNVYRCLHILKNAGIEYEIVFNEVRKSKARALNKALRRVLDSYDCVVVYDAGDIVSDKFHLLKVSKLISEGYTVIGCKVYRVGPGIIGKLSYIDTLLWYNVALPGITKLIGYPLFSGEGLAISTAFLKKIGGFPDRLAEDAYITMLLARYGGKGVLLDSVIYEGSPSSITSLFRQRLRWYRGLLECFKDLVLYHWRDIGLGKSVKIGIAYLQPIASLSTMIAFIIAISTPLALTPSPISMLAIVVVVLIFLAPLYVVIDLKIRDRVLLLAPIYWISQGVIVIASLVLPHLKWLRTSRTLVTIQQTTR